MAPLLVHEVALVVKNPPANAGDRRDVGSIPGAGRSSGGGNGNPLQYSCLENSMDRGAWRATGPGVAPSRTGLSSRAEARKLGPGETPPCRAGLWQQPQGQPHGQDPSPLP